MKKYKFICDFYNTYDVIKKEKILDSKDVKFCIKKSKTKNEQRQRTKREKKSPKKHQSPSRQSKLFSLGDEVSVSELEIKNIILSYISWKVLDANIFNILRKVNNEFFITKKAMSTVRKFIIQLISIFSKENKANNLIKKITKSNLFNESFGSYLLRQSKEDLNNAIRNAWPDQSLTFRSGLTFSVENTSLLLKYEGNENLSNDKSISIQIASIIEAIILQLFYASTIIENQNKSSGIDINEIYDASWINEKYRINDSEKNIYVITNKDIMFIMSNDDDLKKLYWKMVLF